MTDEMKALVEAARATAALGWNHDEDCNGNDCDEECVDPCETHECWCFRALFVAQRAALNALDAEPEVVWTRRLGSESAPMYALTRWSLFVEPSHSHVGGFRWFARTSCAPRLEGGGDTAEEAKADAVKTILRAARGES